MEMREGYILRENQLLQHRLEKYAISGRYPFHMPGHKRQRPGFPDAFSIDITEIEGFDNLHHPEGILKESMEWAAGVYGSDKTYYLVNGSSCGILSAISAAVHPGGKLLMSRNCHKSVYHGVILNQIKNVYVYPQIISELGIQGGILPSDVEKLLEENPDTEAVLIVSPTYDGVVSDIRGIAEAAHRRGIPLIVDEAHGAHFSFSDRCSGECGIPVSALDQGADLVIQSLHKTLPSLTQTAVLHARRRYVDIERLERYLQMYQTSSPSYVLMASIESCIFEMQKHGGQWMDEFSHRVKQMRRELSGLRAIRLLDKAVCGRCGVSDVDEWKLIASVRGCVYRDGNGRAVPADGVWLSNELRERYHLEMEMAGADYVTAILTFCDTQEGLDQLKRALLKLDEQLERDRLSELDELPGPGTEADAVGAGDLPEACQVMTLAEAVDADSEACLLEDCRDRISAEFIYLYPPGIPIVAPGEIVTEEIIERVLRDRAAGLPVQGMADPDAVHLRVLRA